MPAKSINVIKNIYHDAFFCTEVDGDQSSIGVQGAGIWQGCPLSPYLFIIVMTVLLWVI